MLKSTIGKKVSMISNFYDIEIYLAVLNLDSNT